MTDKIKPELIALRDRLGFKKEIDAVIDPAYTRAVLVSALASV